MMFSVQNSYGPKSLLLAFSVGFLLASACWYFTPLSTSKTAIPATPLFTSSVDPQGAVSIHTELNHDQAAPKSWSLKIRKADGTVVKSIVSRDRESLPQTISLGKESVAEGWTYDLSMVTENGSQNNRGELAKTLKPRNVELVIPRFESKAKLTKKVDLLLVTQPDAARREGSEAEALSISITLTKPSSLVIDIFDSSDRRVKRLFEGPHEAGTAKFDFDGYDSEGAPALPGKYRVVADWDGEIVEKWVTLQ